MPTRGRLKFDYVSTRRPRRSSRPLSVRRFIQLCQVLQHTSADERKQLDDLHRLAREGSVKIDAKDLANLERASAATSGLQAKLGAALNARSEAKSELERLEAELRKARGEIEAERAAARRAEAKAKEEQFAVFKKVMDVATQERDAMNAELGRLKGLLNDSVQDILFLRDQNDAYKKELDLRRLHDD